MLQLDLSTIYKKSISVSLLILSLFVLDAFDTEQLLECAEKLRCGQCVQVPIYDFKKHRRSSESFRQVHSLSNVVNNFCCLELVKNELIHFLFVLRFIAS